mgnify:CR=1 FL=1
MARRCGSTIEFNLRAIDAGEIDADAQSLIALESVDCRAPAIGCELGELQPGKLIGGVAQRLVKPAQFDSANRVHASCNLTLGARAVTRG